MRGRITTPELTRAALLTGAALLLSYVESLFPLPLPVPGIKLGLANAAVLAALCLAGPWTAFFVSITRVILSGLLFTGPMPMLYGLAGALASFCGMTPLVRRTGLSVASVSVAGALLHNTAQIALAAAILNTPGLFAYLPPLMLAGTVTGLLTGVATALSLPRLKPVLDK